jgi:hypothetical protein
MEKMKGIDINDVLEEAHKYLTSKVRYEDIPLATNFNQRYKGKVQDTRNEEGYKRPERNWGAAYSLQTKEDFPGNNVSVGGVVRARAKRARERRERERRERERRERERRERERRERTRMERKRRVRSERKRRVRSERKRRERSERKRRERSERKTRNEANALLQGKQRAGDQAGGWAPEPFIALGIA